MSWNTNMKIHKTAFRGNRESEKRAKSAPKLTREQKLKIKIADLKAKVKFTLAEHRRTKAVLHQQVQITKKIQKLIAKW